MQGALTMLSRLFTIWHSYRSLPLWVQVWVGGILVPANATAFLLTDTPSGHWAAWAAVFVVATNVPIMWVEQGMSKLMSVPHLVAWIPLHVFLALRLTGSAGATPMDEAERVLIIVLLVVNGISLAFDLIDSLKWWRGDRHVPGHPA
ncbi:hypothetical protein [Aquabacterium sp. UBA2148]|jgi:hypothetical protein|uniref:hypothetical protein n=1 Tax=Aquabacterium sp. UBA2148 TaxID=1946042 RepID=UPI00257E7B23|nr:hypothetical protein [Aquabacterium sp. UBA2148]